MDAGQITLEQPSDPRGPAKVRICRPGAGAALSREPAEELSAAVDILAADPRPGGVLPARGDRFLRTTAADVAHISTAPREA